MTDVLHRPNRGFRRPIVLFLIALFLLPIAARAAAFAFSDLPRSYRDADWSSIGSLPPAKEYPAARVMVFSGRTGGWKGVFAIHSWIVIKRENASRWTRYDVVGWGNPVRINNWAPDGRWFGDKPTVLADVTGAEAERLIPKIEEAVKDYRFANIGDYRVWPGPNSNTFTATILRAVPELAMALPPNAIGRDFRAGPYVGMTDSGTGVEFNLWGLLGFKLGWVEGFEVNVLGLVTGFDIRNPAVKLPGYGRFGFDAALSARADQTSP